MSEDGFRLGFSIWIGIFLLSLSISSSKSIEVTIYDTTKLDSLGWTTYSPGLQADRLGWREASFSTTRGDVVRVYTICNIDYSVANNWARTPFLQRGEANRLYITMRFTMRKCSRYPDPASVQLCKESFKLFYYESDADFANASVPNWSEETYKSVDIIAADRLFTDIDNATINEITRSIAVTRRGVYLAFYDQGACMTLLSVRVHYVVCPDLVSNLTMFNRTVTGPEVTSVVQTRAVCARHAVAEQALYALCKADGSWMELVSDGCRCLPGFEPDEALKMCSECPMQTYKSQTGNSLCIVCPANSNTTRSGSTGCQCSDGFSRQAFDSVNASCTNLPGPVTNLQVTFVNQTFVSLSWQPPSGRTRDNNDTSVRYRVECLPCESSVSYLPKQSGLISPSVDLTGLKPATSYRVTVYVETGSSPERRENGSGADIAFSTTSFSTGLPRISNLYVARIGKDSVDLVWTVLDVDPVTVSSFEVRYLEMAAGNATHSVSSAFPNATINRLSSNTVYIFQVRGRVQATWGDYSNPVSAKTDMRSGTSETYLPVVSESPNIVAIIVGTAVGVVVCVVIIAVVAVLVVFRRKKQNLEGNSSDCDMLKYINGAQAIGRVHVNQSSCKPSLPSTSGTDSLHIYADPFAYEDPSCYCSRERVCEIEPAAITIESILFKGSFGNICAGKLITRGTSDVPIMIEILNENSSEDDRIHLLSKAEILWRLNHPNVVTLKGVVSKTTPYMMVTEFMPNGSLSFFIKENGFRLTIVDLVRMLHGVACAMEFITEQGYMLRDLSAKSVQVDAGLVCKVASFEMLCSLEADGVQYNQVENVLVRWSSPEVLTHRRYSVASDVWSFAVVMWEVMSLGEIPYSSWPDEQVARAVINGNRLPVPQNCPAVLCQLMATCWAQSPDQRPTFSYLVRNLQSFKQTSAQQLSSVHEPSSPDLTPDLRISPVSLTHHFVSMEISQWLLSLHLSCYAANFHSRGYHVVDHIVHLSEADLEQMGIIVPAHQRTLLRAIRCLKTEASYTGANDYYV